MKRTLRIVLSILMLVIFAIVILEKFVDPTPGGADNAPLDLRRQVYTNDHAYACRNRDDLKDITMAAMDVMDKFGGTFESCSKFGKMAVRALERTRNGIYVRIASASLSVADQQITAAWIFDINLTNTPPNAATPDTGNEVVAVDKPTAPSPPKHGALPEKPGQCAQSTIQSIGTRLENAPGSGSEVDYSNGSHQVSYDTVAVVSTWAVGDQVRMCVVEVERDCPVGVQPGRVYETTNLRTSNSWRESDSEHSCRGA